MVLERPDPQTIVIFGASGDLTRRKVMPAIFDLFRADLMPSQFAVVGYARSPMTDAAFAAKMKAAAKEASPETFKEADWRRFEKHIGYTAGDYSPGDRMISLVAKLRQLEPEVGTKTLMYCATPPEAFPVIASNLGAAGLAEDSRIVVEKPFGRDLHTARDLNAILHASFEERQIFRIDHYLGKETVQNILVFRFANGMFEPIWNRLYVAAVQIDVAESAGVAGRESFYEGAGAIRDIVQNHMMQLLATLTMEPPAKFDAESIRTEKVKLLRAVRPIDPSLLVRGQYTTGKVEGERAQGYRDEKEVSPDSSTETFAAMQLSIDNWRWSGVPFYLRTGKRLPRRVTTITVIFVDAPHMLFEESGIDMPEPNHLTIRIQPDEGITLTFDAKVPGAEMRVRPVDMNFDYDESFRVAPQEAYARLIHDAMQGDATLFTRSDEIERAWEILEPVLVPTTPELYAAGTWGPEGADRLVHPGRWFLNGGKSK